VSPSPKSPTTTLLAEVVLPVPLDRSFTYRIAADAEVEPQVGDLVSVPFGRRRGVVGLVTALRETAGPAHEVDGV